MRQVPVEANRMGVWRYVVFGGLRCEFVGTRLARAIMLAVGVFQHLQRQRNKRMLALAISATLSESIMMNILTNRWAVWAVYQQGGHVPLVDGDGRVSGGLIRGISCRRPVVTNK